jgi:exopolysaccharide biosynthesis polyprenyl glycosylphosphotransferase
MVPTQDPLQSEPAGIGGFVADVRPEPDNVYVENGRMGERQAPPSREIPAARLVATIDVLVVLATFLAVIVGVNVDRMPDGFDEFLAIRITVKNVLVLGGMILAVPAVFRWAGLYEAIRVRRWADEVRRLVVGSTGVTTLAMVVPATSHSDNLNFWSLLPFWAGSFVVLVVARSVRGRLSSSTRDRRRVIIVGTGPRAIRIYRQVCSDVLASYYVVGFVDTTTAQTSSFIARRTLGRIEQLEDVLVREHVDEVHIGLPVKSQYRQIQETIRVCERLGVKAIYNADIFTTRLAKARMPSASDQAAFVQLQMAPDGAHLIVKRILDVCCASALLALLSPVLLAAAIAIRFTSDGPVIYAQRRYGLNRRTFKMFKFRTMVQDADALQASLESRNEAGGPVFKIANDPRITPVGRFLRRTSIDELPQLFNVLRGDMSLVGPRPLPLRDVARFTRTADLRRLSVRPGVTGPWQISGRSDIDFDDWVKLDLQYIDRWSLGLDLRILARTLPAVLKGTGAR